MRAYFIFCARTCTIMKFNVSTAVCIFWQDLDKSSRRFDRILTKACILSTKLRLDLCFDKSLHSFDRISTKVGMDWTEVRQKPASFRQNLAQASTKLCEKKTGSEKKTFLFSTEVRQDFINFSTFFDETSTTLSFLGFLPQFPDFLWQKFEKTLHFFDKTSTKSCVVSTKP